MAQAQYYIEVGNDYLGKYRRVTGRTRREAELKAADQLRRWGEQEARARDRAAMADAKEQAVAATDEAQALLDEYRNVLRATLSVDDRLRWDALSAPVPFSEAEPLPEQFRSNVPPRKPVLEWLRLASTAKREQAEAEAEAAYNQSIQGWQQRYDQHRSAEQRRREDWQRFRTAYESGDGEAVEQYVSLVLGGSAFPAGFPRACKVGYDRQEKAIVIDAELIAPDDLPTLTEVRYIASRREFQEKRLKEKEIAALYEQVVLQTVLRTLHEAFEGDYAAHCRVVTVNGMVEAVDRTTGKDYRACIISCQADRETFTDIDLARVDPAACFRGLKGLSGSALIGLQPVRPIRILDQDDPRFIDAANVLDGLESDQNLMTMAWQDFEVLVRDLFGKMFAPQGCEVKVTQSSRDKGVDAVIFDPDPLLGGKTVVQAKRYRGPVPLAAVRELYGVITNERAGKGILVTTSHFGPQAREFVKDKPLTLIDGPNLLHYLQNHGHHVRIDLDEPSPN